ncbi:peptidoglycan DD-metalloendopeptidase family protein [Wenzhouxiangella sp. EGI_FJ10409]|uniref:peptidoglycan DD-metalloendopeptidase family protein n=1 Tax=Wenzhouxiangella sp. EGI_FJ10409 TaxID=3243767 RepID=UPI0035E27D46
MTANLPTLRLGVLLCAGLLSLGLGAQTIYIWEDEDGIQHFTDRKPVTEREVTVQRAKAEPQKMVDVLRTGTDRDPVWLFRNRTHGPVTVRVSLVEASNVVTEPRLPARFVLDGLEERELVTIGPLEKGRSWSYRFETSGVPGDIGARHEPARPYRAPIASGTRFRIGQAFGGQYSHNSPSGLHAVDIQMPTGTPVHAARGGVVMAVARYFHGAGDDLERDGPRANYVRILHGDGSMGLYAHLDYGGVLVREGQRVERGDRIGRSGNTGYSTGPHLHFAVQVNRDMELTSVPFEFEGENGQAVAPRPGQRLAIP